MIALSPVVRACLYLQVVSIRNALWQRVKRLRQPKYLFGALAGGSYIYFFFLRQVFHNSAHGPDFQVTGLAPELAPHMAAIAALALMVIALLAWIVPSGRAALQFTEAEVAFLFPAPMTRRMLIHYKLLRSQAAIFFSAFLMSLLFRRASFLGGSPVLHAAGWWLLLSTLNLHFMGASFGRERLLEMGVSPARRRALVAGVVLVLAVGCGWWLKAHVMLPAPVDLAGMTPLLNYIGHVLSTPPLAWLLAPFKVVAAPLFAVDATAFFGALGPAALLLVAHYFWVVRSDTAFEEASIDVARRRAERATSFRAGKSLLRNAPTKPRSAPFVLAPSGFVPLAFLWKNLIALGPFFRLRTWLIACAIVIVGGSWLAADPERQLVLKVIAGVSVGVGAWLFLVAPMFMQRGLRQTLEHLDILKASPLQGWQIVLGELLSPMTVMTFLQWLLLLMAAVAFGAGVGNGLMTPANIGIAAVGIGLIVPPLCGLMLCVPFAGLLYFPAWSEGMGSRGGGIEVMGQRMIFFGAYLVALTLALVPAAALGAAAFFAGLWLGGNLLSLALMLLVAGAVLATELAAAVAWLGERVERFDVSQEMPR